MKNIKLNNLIRRFMVLTYITAILTGIYIGLLPENKWWSILYIPLVTSLLCLLAYFINIWVEHRYVTYPFERTAQNTIEANKVLVKEMDDLRLLYNSSVPEESYNRLVHIILEYTRGMAKGKPSMAVMYNNIKFELEFRNEFHKKEAYKQKENDDPNKRFQEKLKKHQEKNKRVISDCPSCNHRKSNKINDSGLITCENCGHGFSIAQKKNEPVGKPNQAPLNAITYKLKAECARDCEKFISAIEENLFGFETIGSSKVPDVEMEFVSDLKLDELISISESLDDLHVIAETLQPIGSYTGVKNYKNNL